MSFGRYVRPTSLWPGEGPKGSWIDVIAGRIGKLLSPLVLMRLHSLIQPEPGQ